MLLTVMLLGLFMNATIPRAFGDAGWVFAVTFLLIHLGRTVWLLRVGVDRRNQEHWRRVLVHPGQPGRTMGPARTVAVNSRSPSPLTHVTISQKRPSG
ncbi:low temperature requirement protein A [Streptomyces sp. LARHCF252]